MGSDGRDAGLPFAPPAAQLEHPALQCVEPGLASAPVCEAKIRKWQACELDHAIKSHQGSWTSQSSAEARSALTLWPQSGYSLQLGISHRAHPVDCSVLLVCRGKKPSNDGGSSSAKLYVNARQTRSRRS